MKRFIAQLVTRFRRWVQARRRLRQFEAPKFYSSEDNPAAAIKARCLAVVGPKEKPKWLRFTCPCGCGDEIVLNLMQAHYPKWTIRLHSDQTVTLHPSVHATKCGSHFWLRRNRVHWVENGEMGSGTQEGEGSTAA